ncbi:PIR protein, partial [Plasmodium vivax]
MVSPQKFEFFNKLDHEKLYEALKYANDGAADSYCTGECTYIHCTMSSMNMYEDICKKINKFFSSLCSTRQGNRWFNSLTSNNYEYINYWLNVKLNNEESKFNSLSNTLSERMKKDGNQCFNKDLFKNTLKYIQKNDFDYMKNIDDLYRNYSNMGYLLKSGKSSNMSCLDYARECHKIYELSIKECPNKGNELYKALETFKTTYESFFGDQTIGSSCHFPDLNK